jgi:RNA polymerase sigma-70 factor (ECF subfamily)
MTAENTRPSLLQRLRDLGDQSSWQEFDTTYRDLILRFCVRQGMQFSDAEDVRQTVMLALAKSLKTFEYHPDRGRFRDYLGRAVRNAIQRSFRGQKPRTVDLEDSTGIPQGSSQLEEAWEREWVLHHYRRALRSVQQTVGPQSVEVFERLVQGASPESIATDLGLPHNTIYKIKQRMRERLMIRVQEQLEDEQLGADRREAADRAEHGKPAEQATRATPC